MRDERAREPDEPGVLVTRREEPRRGRGQEMRLQPARAEKPGNAETRAERERQEIEANKQLAELAPLKSEFIQIRYAKAANVVTLFEAGSE